MRGIVLLAPLAMGPVLLTAACDSETGDGVADLPLEEFVAAYEQAACEHTVTCNYMPDVDTCKATMSRAIQKVRFARGVSAVAAGTIQYDAAAAQSCIEAVRSGSCQSGVLFPLSLRNACDGVFTGRKAEGEPCYDAVLCDGAASACEGACDDQCCMGTCRAGLGVAQLGEECSDQKPCVDSAFCGIDEITGLPSCLERVEAGQSCPYQGSCVIGYGCDPGSNTCFKQAPEGGSCNSSVAADVCSHIGEFCSPDTMTCQRYPGTGDPCGLGCSRFGACSGTECVALPMAGGACPGNQCMGELECDAGTCLPLAPVVLCSE